MKRVVAAIFVLSIATPFVFADSREDKVNRAIKELESGVPKTRAAACEDIGKIAAIRASYGKPAIDRALGYATTGHADWLCHGYRSHLAQEF